jgi:hypothetical protein
MAAMINAYKILVGKPEGRRPLGIPRSKWEGTGINFMAIRLEDADLD